MATSQAVRECDRCVAITKSGAVCRNRTCRGAKCWIHTKTQEGLRIKPSQVANGGFGLHTTRRFPAGAKLADYAGEKLTRALIHVLRLDTYKGCLGRPGLADSLLRAALGLLRRGGCLRRRLLDRLHRGRAASSGGLVVVLRIRLGVVSEEEAAAVLGRCGRAARSAASSQWRAQCTSSPRRGGGRRSGACTAGTRASGRGSGWSSSTTEDASQRPPTGARTPRVATHSARPCSASAECLFTCGTFALCSGSTRGCLTVQSITLR